ncbi:MAG TPA: Uma2 family endonuclease [Chloroflexota bacterium]|nr:Uma2 family endonuclease [Chloroflexota bacterium]
MTAPAYADLPRTPAPWAEIVPGHGPATVDLLTELPDDGHIYEVVEGVLVRMAGSGKQATTIAATLLAALTAYVRPRRLGIITGADGVYKFPGAETGLIPDLGFYLAERDALIEDDTKPIPFAPDLAVEVASPSQLPAAMAAKSRLYLRAGTRLVWVIWPRSGHIDLWRHHILTGPASVLTLGGTLSGEDIIPGFSYAVDELFLDPLGPER